MHYDTMSLVLAARVSKKHADSISSVWNVSIHLSRYRDS